MLYAQNPIQEVFEWYCGRINASENDLDLAAEKLQPIVKQIRTEYKSPFGKTFTYGDTEFQNGYLVAYFPYYIEPIYHVLKETDLSGDLLAKESLRVSFFGGGPCPEALGVSAFLREEAAHLKSVDIAIFDREKSWDKIHRELLTGMIKNYSGNTHYTIEGCHCNVSACAPEKCSSRKSIVGSDLVVAQNFMSEVTTVRLKNSKML